MILLTPLKRILMLPLLLLFSSSVLSQVKSLVAIKITQAPKIDGKLDDAAWSNIPVATDFIQNYPKAGAPASARSEVKIVYDNSAVYIGAYLYDDPANIRKQVTSRDDEGQKDVDYFSVFLDTYDDHQNGFQFLVTSQNVQSDAKLGPNLGTGMYGDYGDKTWDAVWESKVSITEKGWVVEMKIPYISLRFAKKEVQNWGLQFLRFSRKDNETCFWNNEDPNVSGFVSQFGTFIGLKDIQPPLRLSFSPYVSTGTRSVPEANNTTTNTWLHNGGMDVKYGVNESFTLDATIVPDFGQVISDNVINNLSPFEVKLDDYRPFFTEGTELFGKSGLFYSRRVGATPSGYQAVKDMVNADPNLEIVKNPTVTQLYNAVKFSGRTEKKLGVGFFNAVTAPMTAIIKDKTTGGETKIETEPLTNYNILVLDQALRGQSYVTFTNTNVIRNGAGADANVSAFDFSMYDKKNRFNIKGTGRYSKIFSTSGKDGYNAALQLGKVSGNWQYTLKQDFKSPDYDPNDLGYLQSPNAVTTTNVISYKQFKPKGNLLNYIYSLTTAYSRFYKPWTYGYVTSQASGLWIFKNFWDVTLALGYFGTQHDYWVLGNPATYGRFVKRPLYGYANVYGSTDSRKKLFVSYNLLFADFFHSAPDKNYHNVNGEVRYRFSNKFTLDLYHSHEAETDYIISAGRELNGDPRIAFVDFADMESILSGIYNFTPRINLTIRARHYLSRVKFNRFANVDADGNPTPRSGTTNFDNVNYFNFDGFFTWDFRLGSKLILGYKNWLGDNEVYNPN
ncbi:MAG: carbohydrate binding family 9 domain-containing protein, partial [Bacteroidetes bacterium]|nr:carbohydrate binding family 9 domain-containing protein [Bacteroidota bacterium]